MVSYTPARGENHKICNGHTWASGLGSQNGENRGILEIMIQVIKLECKCVDFKTSNIAHYSLRDQTPHS